LNDARIQAARLASAAAFRSASTRQTDATPTPRQAAMSSRFTPSSASLTMSADLARAVGARTLELAFLFARWALKHDLALKLRDRL
jgi:hypothetical protein